MIYTFCMLISSMFEIYLAFDFLKSFFDWKAFAGKRWVRFLAYSGLTGINFVVNLSNSTMLNIIIVSMLYIAMGCGLFQGKNWVKVLHSIYVLLLGFSSELIVSLLLSLPFNISVKEALGTPFFMISSIFTVKMLQFILLILVKQNSKITTVRMDPGLFLNYMLVPVASFGVMFSIPYIRVGGQKFSTMDMILVCFYILLLIANIRLFYAFRKYSYIQEQQRMYEVNIAKFQESRAQYEKLYEADKEQREWLHNINYHLHQIGIYAQTKQLEKIKETLQSLQIDFSNKRKEKLCSNDFLDVLLQDYKEKAKKADVQMSIFVEQGYQLANVSEMDMTVLFGNLLRNAIEAATKKTEGYVEVKCFKNNKGAFSMIYIENNYSGNIEKKEGKFITNKLDKQNHGIGLYSVERIVGKYQGYITQSFDGDIFATTVMFPQPHM